jgi:integrase
MWFADWLNRPIDEIALEEVEARYTQLKGRGRHAMTALRAVVTSAANRFDTQIITRRLHDVMSSNGNRRELPRSFDDDFAGSTRRVLQHVCAWVHPAVRMGNLIAAFTGLRKDNILKLRWKDINFGTQILTIHDHKTVKVVGTMRLPIPTHLAQLLSHWKDRSQINEWVLPGSGASGHLTEIRGVYDGDGGLNALFQWGLDDDPFTAHSWRRVRITAAENLLGISESTAKFLHGQKPSGVRGVYNVATLDAMRPAQERLANWLNSLHRVVDVC